MAPRSPWFKCYPDRLLGALSSLSPEAGYTYAVVLLRIYEADGPVLETARTLSRRTGLTERKVADALTELCAFGKLVRLDDGRLDSSTTHDELASRAERREACAGAGKASAEKRSGLNKKTSAENKGQKTQQNQGSDATSVQQMGNDIDIERKEITKEKIGGADAPGNDEAREGKSGKTAPVGKPDQARIDEAFNRFRAAYPKRKGDDPRAPAHKRFTAKVKAGADPERIIAGAAAFAATEAKRGSAGSEFIPHSSTWLNAERWEDSLEPETGTLASRSPSDEIESWRLPVANWRRDPTTWTSHAWGPAPGEAGSSVTPAMLRLLSGASKMCVPARR